MSDQDRTRPGTADKPTDTDRDATSRRGTDADPNVEKPSEEQVSQEKQAAAGATGTDDSKVMDPAHPNEPAAVVGETAEERSDRHIASGELEVERVTDLETQGDTSVADDAKEKIVKGAAVGPDDAGIVRNEEGRVAYAPPGSRDAADAGVQQDASGHVDSVGTDNTSKSGTRA